LSKQLNKTIFIIHKQLKNKQQAKISSIKTLLLKINKPTLHPH